MAKKTVRRKHIPQRSCIVCREKKDKRRLTRIVRTPEGAVLVDPTGKRNGRGSYLCDKGSCWRSAVSGKALDRALNVEVSEEDRQALKKHMPVDILDK